ncbi:glycosyltransferase [Dyadobacter sp. 676]|uniref:Glycosyltransferase n=1 Tax=Dyadobacter sp. 676 TaxID=3088362 RepID=A0AAU8FJV3_9BACT
MQKVALFLPASIKSHVFPLFSFCDVLSEEFDVYFSVSNEVLKSIVASHGYKALLTTDYRVGVGMEDSFVASTLGKSGWWSTLKCVLGDKVLKHRQKELSEVISKISPTLIFIDIFNSTDLLVLNSLGVQAQYILINPMLSTLRTPGFPNVDQDFYPKTVPAGAGKDTRFVNLIKAMVVQPKSLILRLAREYRFKHILRHNEFSTRHPISKDCTKALIFNNFREFILAPLELEISPSIRREHQVYLGLSVNDQRQSPEEDELFSSVFRNIVQGLNGRKLIYCSFGTFYEGSDRALFDFLEKLISALERIDDVVVIFSVNQLVIDTIVHNMTIKKPFYFFKSVAQLEVLKVANLFVTHGGLGSVKESIFCGTPMLVYPLDMRYDQNGNAFKVVHHGIGLKGEFRHERASDIYDKINRLLGNGVYKKNIDEMSKKLRATYSPKEIKKLLKKYIDESECL